MKSTHLKLWTTAGLKANGGYDFKQHIERQGSTEVDNFYGAIEAYVAAFKAGKAKAVTLSTFITSQIWCNYISGNVVQEPVQTRIDFKEKAEEDPYKALLAKVWPTWPNHNPKFNSAAYTSLKTIDISDLVAFEGACKAYISSLKDSPKLRLFNFDKFIEWGEWQKFVYPDFSEEALADFEKSYEVYPDFRSKATDKFLNASKYFSFVMPEERLDFFLACKCYATKNSPFVMPYLLNESDVDLKDPKLFNRGFVMSFTSFLGEWDKYINPHILVQPPIKLGLHLQEGFYVQNIDPATDRMVSRITSKPSLNYSHESLRKLIATRIYPSKALFHFFAKKARAEISKDDFHSLTYDEKRAINDAIYVGTANRNDYYHQNPLKITFETTQKVYQYVLDMYGVKSVKTDLYAFQHYWSKPDEVSTKDPFTL